MSRYSDYYQNVIHGKVDKEYEWTGYHSPKLKGETIKIKIYSTDLIEDIVIYQLDGSIDHASVGKALLDNFTEEVESGKRKFIIDCTDLVYIAPTAGGIAFWHLIKKLKNKEGVIILVNCNEEFLIRSVFHNILIYSRSIEDAVCIALNGANDENSYIPEPEYNN